MQFHIFIVYIYVHKYVCCTKERDLYFAYYYAKEFDESSYFIFASEFRLSSAPPQFCFIDHLVRPREYFFMNFISTYNDRRRQGRRNEFILSFDIF